MAIVRLEQLDDAIELLSDEEGLGANEVTTVENATRFEMVADAGAGAIVVLGEPIVSTLRSYRFDLALGEAHPAVAAVVWAARHDAELSTTARRICAKKSIALGRLHPDVDAVSLAVRVRDLSSDDRRADDLLLERVCELTDACHELLDVPALLDAVGVRLGTTLSLVERPTRPGDLPLRVHGLVPRHLAVGLDAPTPIVRSAITYVARHVEALLVADHEAREIPETTVGELLGEILLRDVGTSADAASRLRRSDFPIDGSHLAVRIDCHDPVDEALGVQATYRLQQRIGEELLAAARASGDRWTRTGTAQSIVLLSSRRAAHPDGYPRECEALVAGAVADVGERVPGLGIHIGIGTAHLGVAGVQTTVNEATSALRSAKDRGRVNDPVSFDRLGFGRALVRWAEIDGVRPVVDEILSPLLVGSPRRAHESITTLRTYLDCGRNVSETAARLHLHRNTVRYRLDRITDALPVDLDDPDERLLVELSCRVIATSEV
ncbi:MAG: helix-turn-helix domain-containing protein [Actinomycetota bacterium]